MTITISPVISYFASWITKGITKTLALDETMYGVILNETLSILSNTATNGIMSNINYTNVTIISIICLYYVYKKYHGKIKLPSFEKKKPEQVIIEDKPVIKQDKIIIEVHRQEYIGSILEYICINPDYFDKPLYSFYMEHDWQVLDNLPVNFSDSAFNISGTIKFKRADNKTVIIFEFDKDVQVDPFKYIQDLNTHIIGRAQADNILSIKNYRQTNKGFDYFDIYHGKNLPDDVMEHIFIGSFFHPMREEIWNQIKILNNNPHEFYKFGMSPRLGFLLHGPPGTGKSSFAYRMSRLLKRDIICFKLSSYNSFEELFHDLCNPQKFLSGRKPENLIYLFDEFDAIIERLAQPVEQSMQEEFTKHKILIDLEEQKHKKRLVDIMRYANNTIMLSFKKFIKDNASDSNKEREPKEVIEYDNKIVSTLTDIILDNFNESNDIVRIAQQIKSEFNLSIGVKALIDATVYTSTLRDVRATISLNQLVRCMYSPNLWDNIEYYSDISMGYRYLKSPDDFSKCVRGWTIDAYISAKNAIVNQNKKKLRFEDLQEIFDGAVPIIGAIIIATTNRYEYIYEKCPALVRPGRLTPYLFGNMTDIAMKQLTEYYFKRQPGFAIGTCDKLMPAYVVNVAMQCVFKTKTNDEAYDEFYKKITNTLQEYETTKTE